MLPSNNGVPNWLRYACILVPLCAILIVATGIAFGTAATWAMTALSVLAWRVVMVVLVAPPDR
jgi:hypothetical protein